MAKRASHPKRYVPVTRPKFTVYLRPELRERAQNCVEALSDQPERLTMTALIERALLTEVDVSSGNTTWVLHSPLGQVSCGVDPEPSGFSMSGSVAESNLC